MEFNYVGIVKIFAAICMMANLCNFYVAGQGNVGVEAGVDVAGINLDAKADVPL